MRRDSEVKISATIESGGDSRELWFAFDAQSEPESVVSADPFVVALILVAMQSGEAIEVRAPLSRRLAMGLSAYQEQFARWYPDRFKKVEIRAESLCARESRGMGVACAFSGGVDSFYTYLRRHAPQSGGQPGLTHALFMAGFDMPLNLTQSIGALTASFSEMMRESGVKLITGRTNVRQFVNTVDWTNAHGQALAAAALCFQGVLKQFYIPSSYLRDSHPKWGTHPELDLLLSTEALEFVHDGADANRVQKLERIAQARESYSRLRVCWIQDIGLRNCGECEKCVRTMVALDLLGALGRYTTFPTVKLTSRRIRSLPQRTYQGRKFARELMGESLKRGRVGRCLDLGWSLAFRRLRRLGRAAQSLQ